MIFDSDKMCSENFHSAGTNGTINHFHPRNVNGLVDPLSFSAINFLRTYNRLVAPNDIAHCYNLTLLKDNRNSRNIPLPLPPLPIQTILATAPVNNTTISSSPIATTTAANFTENSLQHTTTLCPADFNSPSSIRLQSPPNRTVSSTCPSTPTEPTTPSATMPALNHHHHLSTLTTSLSPNFMRRQRGEKRPIPDEQKDEKYYERRKRNNEAAKKSRDARKMREDRVAFRAAMLEQENAILRAQLLAQREEISTLRQLLCTRA